MAQTLLVAIAALSGLALMLAVPLRVAFQCERVEAFKGRIAVRWLFGLVRFHVDFPNGKRSAARTASRPVTQAPAKLERRSGRLEVLVALGQAAFRRRVYRLLRDVLCALDVHQLRLRMRVGLGDPADTGRLWALLGPLNVWALSLRSADVRIDPEFMDAVCEFQARGQLLLIPLRFLSLALGFALSPASIRAWCSLRSSHA